VLDKGQEDDWFGALWVRWAVPRWLRAVGWIWHSWTHPKGLVDLHILRDRNFRTGCFLIAMLGMCIYITIAILPLYYQEVLGYTAFTAGLVVGPRGIGSFHRLAGGRLLGSRIDNRKLLCADSSPLASARWSSARSISTSAPIRC
jgi:MFS transporter, DHA2 family, multidrug resistance protein